MRRMHVGIIMAGALVGVLAAIVTARLTRQPAPEPTAFVSADGQSLIELPSDPTPLEGEAIGPEPVGDQTNTVLLEPVPMTGIEVTVAHRSAEPVPENEEAPSETPAVPELVSMPTLLPGVLQETPSAPLVSAAPPSAPAPTVTRGELGEAISEYDPPQSTVPEPVPAPQEAPVPGVAAVPEPVAAPQEAPVPGVAAAPEPVPAPQEAPAPGVVVAPVPAPVAAPVPPPPPEVPPCNRSAAAANAPPPAQPVAATPAPVMRSGPLPLPALVMAVGHKRASHADQVPATGTYTCSLEKQSELSLSSSACAELDRPRVLFVALAPDKKCLWVYTTAGVDRLAEQLDHSAGNDEMSRCTRRKVFSRLQRVHAGTDGTFLLPAELVEVASFKDGLLLIGVRDHFELWDAHQWQQYIGQEEPAEPPASEPASAPHPGYGFLAPGVVPDALELCRSLGELGEQFEIQGATERRTAVVSQLLIVGNDEPNLLLQKTPPMQTSGPGRLRRASFSVDRRQAYVLENVAGRPVLYVTAQTGLNLEPYVDRTVELMGPVIYHDMLRTNYMTAGYARLLR